MCNKSVICQPILTRDICLESKEGFNANYYFCEINRHLMLHDPEVESSNRSVRRIIYEKLSYLIGFLRQKLLSQAQEL